MNAHALLRSITYHVECAYRKEELPLLAHDYERQQKVDHEAFRSGPKSVEGVGQTSAPGRSWHQDSPNGQLRKEALSAKKSEEFVKKKEAARRKIEEKEKRSKAILKSREEEKCRLEEADWRKREEEEEERRLEEGTNCPN
ncbi:hypothetical protein APHAL10511_000026 [Amanita phalloides]|nr:hypothetical protein APHAL10511_000026 [Amanita phalloides]